MERLDMSGAGFSLAIDVGGTFTDVVLLERDSGALVFAKVLSTPDDPSRGSLIGSGEILARNGTHPEAVGEVVHATTVATNAVLERKGARTGLLTTKGFRDTLEIGRESRYDIYDLDLRLPEPLVPRERRLEVDERVSAEGEVLTNLDEAAATRAIKELVERHDVEALAICLINSIVFPDFERRLADIARRLYPNLAVSISHDVGGEIREYERTSTTVVDAYVKPMVRHYVGRMSEGLRDQGLTPRMAMMLSHGGIGSAVEVANSFPVRMIESGPAAGAMAAAYFARSALEVPNAIAFDMGGTTAKISVIQEGEPAITNAFEVGHVRRFKRGSGLPLQITAIELLEIGAGGGSIAHVNSLGLLNVGPRSAGAAPGPACYGLGGADPTVTDADLLLGYLDPAHFLGGDMTLDPELAREAAARKIATPLEMSVEDVAWGIHDVVNENMAAATRAHAAEKGIDLRDHAMIAFGGAGPVHAYAIARKLGLRRVLCPVGAGVASAIGCLTAPPAIDLVSAHEDILDGLDWTKVRAAYDEMRGRAAATLKDIIGDGADLSLRGSMDMRCQGQGYAITVSMPDGASLDETLVGPLSERFGQLYAEIHGHRPPDVPLEITNLRARLSREGAPISLVPALPPDQSVKRAAVKGRRPLYFPSCGGFVDGDIYDRYALSPGDGSQGPAVIEERETSVVIGPDARFVMDGMMNLIIDINGPGEARR
jgi:N-methylhydantoinase A